MGIDPPVSTANSKSSHGDIEKDNGDVIVKSSPAPSVSQESDDSESTLQEVPLKWKLIAILMVTAIGFGSKWSSGITGAMKSTMKKQMKINNKQFALLEASEDFMVTVLMLFSGIVTDRIGGARAMLYGNAIYSVGAILVAGAAQVRSYRFMIGGRVIQALGDIATQVAQYKVFSSWFAPGNGFASTLGFELGIGKIGAFAGKSSANIIAVKKGDFAWVFWVAVFMNLFTNVMTVAFYLFTKLANSKFHGVRDPTTKLILKEKSKKFEIKKVLELPWSFWCILAFSLFQTSTANVFLQNATELAEQRFKVSAITAGWYSATSQYAGFFLVPIIGVCIDMFGNRISLLAFCGCGVFTSMLLLCFGNAVSGTAASMGIFAFAFCFGPTTIIDSIRTSMWHPSVFGSAYALKITMNNAMNIIVRVVTSVIQDADDNSYDRVVIVYAILSGLSVLVAFCLIGLACATVDLGHLQWTRKQRLARVELLVARRDRFMTLARTRNKNLSMAAFAALLLLVVGSWAAYFWGVATGNNE